MNTLTTLGISLCLSPFALGSIKGPMYPPTNGVTFSYLGEADQGRGRTNTYTEMSMNNVAARWWGDDGTPIINSLRNSTDDVVAFNAGMSDLARGVAVFTGTSPFTYLLGSGMVTTTVQTRFTLTTTDLIGVPLPLFRGSELEVVGSVLTRVDANDFNAHLLFEARDPLTGAWTPTRDLYNSYNTTGVGSLITFVGGFYEADPPPCPADFNDDGGIDGADVESFFAAWEAGDDSADVNADGGIDGSDVEVFFIAWEAGGC